MAREFQIVEDCKLAYELMGTGEPVVIAHGFGLNREATRGLAERLADRYRVVIFDGRGHGETDSPAEDSAFSYPRLRDDLLGLMDGLGIQRAHLVGQSMGGQIALMAAIAAPERVMSLTTLGAGPCRAVVDPKEENAWRRSAEFFASAGSEKLVHALVASAPPLHPDRDEPFLRGVYESARGEDLAHMIRGAFLTVENNDDDCTRIETPTLIVVGEKDAQWLEASRKLHRHIAGSKLIEISGAGHLAWLDEPEATAGEVLRFLARAAGSA